MSEIETEEGVSESSTEEGAAQAQDAGAGGEETMAKDAKGGTHWGVGVMAVLALVALFWPAGDGIRDVPEGKLLDNTEHEVFLSKRLSPVTLVHFWATWCVPCIDEVKLIRALADDLSSEPDFGLVMVAVADDQGKIVRVLGEDVAEETLYDPDWKVTKRFDTHKLPETHLVQDGKIIDSFIGVTDWSSESVRRRVQAALVTTPGP